MLVAGVMPLWFLFSGCLVKKFKITKKNKKIYSVEFVGHFDFLVICSMGLSTPKISSFFYFNIISTLMGFCQKTLNFFFGLKISPLYGLFFTLLFSAFLFGICAI